MWLLITLYRRINHRPHCNQANSRHAWTCKLAMPLLAPFLSPAQICKDDPEDWAWW